MAFLALFTYMVLVDYDPDRPSASEWLIMLWILSFLIGASHSVSKIAKLAPFRGNSSSYNLRGDKYILI